jgi:4-oxalocrotonate tautomerase
MPTVTVRAFEGRTVEQKRQLAKDITDAVVKNFKVEPDRVTVNFFDMPRHNVARAGKLSIDQ